jgi:hypothetical protein
MIETHRSAIAAALCGLQLAACAPLAPSPGAGNAENQSGVIVREDLSQRFVALIGPEIQDGPPYLGTPGTNYSRLRSFFDRQTGETAHQLYVVASYDAKRDWDAAHDDHGAVLTFIPISRLKIACDGNEDCDYAEEFAAKIPASELNDNQRGFSITFTDHAGHAQTIMVSAEQVTTQLAAVAKYESRSRSAPSASDQKP